MHTEMKRAPTRWLNAFGPAMLILLAIILFLAPGSTLDKMNMLCFGI